MPTANPYLPAPDPTPNQVGGLAQNQLTPNNAAYYGNKSVPTPNNAAYYGQNNNGQVLGASTTGQAASGGQAGGGGYNSLLTAANQGINSQYDTYISGLDKQVGLAGQNQQSMLDKVNNLFGTNQASINSSQQGAMDQLTQSRTDVGTRQAQTLRDLEQNLSNQYQAANRQLGAVGAGDSSATGQYQYALARLGSQQRSKILQNANELYNQINMKMSEVKRVAGDQLNQLNGWKNDNLINIQRQYQNDLASIEKEKSGANAQRQAELNQIMVQIKSQAINNLQQVQDQHQSYADAIGQWAQKYAADYEAAHGQLQQFAGNPNDISQAGQFDAGSGALGNTSLTLGELGSQGDLGRAFSSGGLALGTGRKEQMLGGF